MRRIFEAITETVILIFMLSHRTRKDTILPLAHSVSSTSGEEINAIPLRRNTNVIIAIEAANRRPDVWGPDASDWRPERWLERLPQSVVDARLPCVYQGM